MADQLKIMIFATYSENEKDAFCSLIETFISSSIDKLDENQKDDFIIDVNNYRESINEWNRQFYNLTNTDRAKVIKREIKTEKDRVANLYYANNQSLSYDINNDLKTFQPYRKDLAKNNQIKMNDKDELSIISEYKKKYEQMNVWSTKVKSIFVSIAGVLQKKQMNLKMNEMIISVDL